MCLSSKYRVLKPGHSSRSPVEADWYERGTKDTEGTVKLIYTVVIRNC